MKNNNFVIITKKFWLKKTKLLSWKKIAKISYYRRDNNGYTWFPDGKINIYDNCFFFRFLYILQLLSLQGIYMYRLIDGFLILLLVTKSILNLIFLCVILQNQLIQLSVFVVRFEHLLLIYV